MTVRSAKLSRFDGERCAVHAAAHIAGASKLADTRCMRRMHDDGSHCYDADGHVLQQYRDAYGEGVVDATLQLQPTKSLQIQPTGSAPVSPIPMLLSCPVCHARHIDKGEFATRPHKVHTCQNHNCGMHFQPALVPTVGVQFLPGCQS